MIIIAIDPGNTQSGVAVIDTVDCRPLLVDKLDNHLLLGRLTEGTIAPNVKYAAIEMVASYGMPVGREVFETCVWIGRFMQALTHAHGAQLDGIELVYRRDVKLHVCGQSRAKDANITQALVDRFTPGQPNRGKGTKTNPGHFYGFRADMWQAYALAVTVADQIEGMQP